MGDVIDMDSRRRMSSTLTRINDNADLREYVGTCTSDDGSRGVMVTGVLPPSTGLAMTASQARELAACIMTAADLLEEPESA